MTLRADDDSSAVSLSNSFNKNFALAHNQFLRRTEDFLADTTTKSKVNAILSQIISIYKPQYDSLFNIQQFKKIRKFVNFSSFQKFYEYLSMTTSSMIEQNNNNFRKFHQKSKVIFEDTDFVFIQTTINIMNFMVNTIKRTSENSNFRLRNCTFTYADKYTMAMKKAYEGIYDGPKSCLNQNVNITLIMNEIQNGISVWKKSYSSLRNCLVGITIDIDEGIVQKANECVADVSQTLSSDAREIAKAILEASAVAENELKNSLASLYECTVQKVKEYQTMSDSLQINSKLS
jgi:hypothetical protein